MTLIPMYNIYTKTETYQTLLNLRQTLLSKEFAICVELFREDMYCWCNCACFTQSMIVVRCIERHYNNA